MDIIMSDDVVSEINNNLDYILEIIPEIRYMIGFDHKHPHHPNKLEKRKNYLNDIEKKIIKM